MNKQMELALKLKELADRGVEGEKETAQQMLERHCKKHGINIADLEQDKKETFYCKIGTEETHRRLWAQVVISILGMKADYGNMKGYKYRMERWVECTKAQYIEIEAKFEFYLRVYRQEESMFMRAFIFKNDIYSPFEEDLRTSELSDEERAELRRIAALSENINRNHFAKQIKS